MSKRSALTSLRVLVLVVTVPLVAALPLGACKRAETATASVPSIAGLPPGTLSAEATSTFIATSNPAHSLVVTVQSTARTPTFTVTASPTALPSPTLAPSPTPRPTVLPTATPTAIPTKRYTETGTIDWAVYRNDEYGFEFEYPAIYDEYEWEGTRACKPQEYIVGTPNKPKRSTTIASRTLLEFFTEDQALEDYVDQLVRKAESPGAWELESKEIGTVGGVQAITIVYEFGETLTRYGIATFFKREDMLFIVEYSIGNYICDVPAADVYEVQAYDHLIASFRFLD